MRQRRVAGACLGRGPGPVVSVSEPRLCVQLDELDRATELAEKDFARFRIERSELASRRSWNMNTRAQVRATAPCPVQGKAEVE